jgi:hypothetical protein
MKPVVEILRIEENFQYGTFGVMRINKEVFCVTLEPPDKENVQDISSIPAQQYLCKRIISPKYSECFEIQNVPGRSHVLFHAGNVIEHTKGCVILAEHYGKLYENRAILNSGNTFKKFMKLLAVHDVFHLTVIEVY